MKGEYFKNFLDQYEQQTNKNLEVLQKPKNSSLTEQSQRNKENFISNIKKKINNYGIKDNTSEITKTKISTEELLR